MEVFFVLNKRKGIFGVSINEPMIKLNSKIKIRNDIMIKQVNKVVLRQLETGSCQERTLFDYD